MVPMFLKSSQRNVGRIQGAQAETSAEGGFVVMFIVVSSVLAVLASPFVFRLVSLGGTSDR